MDGSRQSATVTIDLAALDRVMPMHVCLAPDGRIRGIGPTLARISPAQPVGHPFLSAFDIRRPAQITSMDALRRRVGQKLHLAYRALPDTGLRGIALPLDDGGLLVNLSFGIHLPDAVRRFRLSDADFAPTDLAVELLYLLEVKQLVMDELADLNQRLQGAKSAAEEQAQTDTLTGLRNRRALDARLQALSARGETFGLMHLDLDFFKQVNDTMGHAAGDAVLVHVARVLVDETRQQDTVARVGGDEFVLLLPGMVDGARLARIAARIIDRLCEPIAFEGRFCQISASIGMAVSSDYDPPDPDRMFADADTALYASKRAGRGRATLHAQDPRHKAADSG